MSWKIENLSRIFQFKRVPNFCLKFIGPSERLPIAIELSGGLLEAFWRPFLLLFSFTVTEGSLALQMVDIKKVLIRLTGL